VELLLLLLLLWRLQWVMVLGLVESQDITPATTSAQCWWWHEDARSLHAGLGNLYELDD